MTSKPPAAVADRAQHGSTFQAPWRAPARMQLTMVLIIVSVVGWRRGVYYSGGLDAVFVAKALLSGIAFALMLTTLRARGVWSSFRATPVIWLVAYAFVATIGGTLGGTPVPSLVLAIRLLLLASTIVLIVMSFSFDDIISALAGALVLVSGVSAVTGIGELAATGRLYGGIPPLNANEICREAGIALLITVWAGLRTNRRGAMYLIAPVLIAVIWLTGSRTGMAAIGVGLLLVIATAPQLPRIVFAGAVLAVPALIAVTLFTTAFDSLAGRGDVTTLSNRTIAWQAALNFHETPTEQLFGSGLNVKMVPVSAQFRDEQILDSSWVSALVQGGYLGFALLTLFALYILIRALRCPRRERAILLPILVTMLLASFLESGLVDSTTAFFIFFLAAMLASRVEPVAADPAITEGAA